MKLIRIEPGSFSMGSQTGGDFDERPVHKVAITRAFFMGATEVTNAQYEESDPAHRQLRGKLGFSKEDDEAVVFVSWHDAVRFCEWLSQKEGRPYRLPTEAEWEYACRAGTITPFWTGETLPREFQKNARQSWFPDEGHDTAVEVVPLTVGLTAANAWGLHDMHGNVEEWCGDWYGPYSPDEQRDPSGPADGDFRVTRGGSHSTLPEYLRSANRAGTLPEDKSWLIGFRVVQGEGPAAPVRSTGFSRNAGEQPPEGGTPTGGPPEVGVPPLGGVQGGSANEKPPEGGTPTGRPPEGGTTNGASKPFFTGPRQYVKIPPGSEGPLFSKHNHDPAVVECPNGDLLAIWYTCRTEQGRELAVASSRLRRGAEEWEPAAPFWDAPDRNDHAPALWSDGQGTIYHFNGLSAAATWGNLALVMRTSTDSGATWSRARLIAPEHGLRHQPVESVFRTQEGAIVLPCDAVSGGRGGTAVHLSRDGGKTWSDPGAGRPKPIFRAGETGAWIAGIHAGVTQLGDGRLLALGRGDSIQGQMPMSTSTDLGQTWSYGPSPFPPIGGGQRLALLRLREGPVLLASFAKKIAITDAAGRQREVSGLFAALSEDDSRTWSVRRLISDDGPSRTVDGGGNTGKFVLGRESAETAGYLSVCQAADGVIHLISSRQHYAFNLAWLKTSPPAL